MNGCGQCGGIGWIHFTKPVTAYDCDGKAVVVQNDYSRPCQCHPRNFSNPEPEPARRSRPKRDWKTAAMGDE